MAAIEPLAVAMGDPAGIGPEIIAKAWKARALHAYADQARRMGSDLRSRRDSMAFRGPAAERFRALIDDQRGTMATPNAPLMIRW